MFKKGKGILQDMSQFFQQDPWSSFFNKIDKILFSSLLPLTWFPIVPETYHYIITDVKNISTIIRRHHRFCSITARKSEVVERAKGVLQNMSRFFNKTRGQHFSTRSTKSYFPRLIHTHVL